MATLDDGDDLDRRMRELQAAVERAQRAQQAVNALITRWRLDDDGCWRIDGRHCWIWIQARVPHCDRGNWLAHVEPKLGTTPRDLHLDHQDGWPRYYFNLDRAKLECEAWLKKRGQWKDE